MLFNDTTFIGIDPTAGKRPITYAALDHELRLLALGDGDIDTVTAFVGGQQAAFVAINSPRRPNQGVMADPEVRDELSPKPRPGRWTGFRLAEYQLYQHNIRIPRTPSKVENCQVWMRVGFNLYQRLQAMGFQDYWIEDAANQLLEVYPHGAYSVLLERIPLPKRSLEGRLQRQLALHSRTLDVPDPMRIFEEITRFRLMQGILPLEKLYTYHELEALVAAYTAWAAAKKPDEVTLLGDAEEGQIVLPAAALKTKY